MTVVKSKTQTAIIILGILSLGIAIWTMLKLQTVIISSLYLVLLYTPIIIGISFVLGLITRKLIKSNWYRVTFTSIYVTIFSLLFCINQYSPTYQISIPKNYVGDIYLIVTTETENDFNINEFGVGYITEETYKEGFTPKVIKNGKDITKNIRGLSRSSTSLATPDLDISFDYLTFEIPGNNDDWTIRTVEALIEQNKIDLNRLKKK